MAWQSDTTLWASAVQVAPTTRAQANYARALLDTDHWETALPWMQQLDRSIDVRAPRMVAALVMRARQLQYPACDVPQFSWRCAE
jgi:hypothetical protein